jgi:nitrous oxide reductase accessory protein NosL
MIELTEGQRGELEKHQPAMVRDPKTNQVYVLLPKEVYERVRQIVQDTNERADWDDPAFDVYDQEAT